MKRCFFLLISLLIFFALLPWTGAMAQSPTGVISGKIIHASTNQPLEGANIILRGQTIGAATDREGFFRIPSVPVGSYELVISSLGFKPVLVTDIVIRSNRVTQVNRSLEEAFIEAEEVIVEGGRYFEENSENLTSAQSLSYEEIRRAAGAIGDVLRLTQALPGVAITNDQRNDLVVRGGSPSENLVLIDNIEIPSLNHFGAQNTSGGPISMLNTEFLSDASFFSGGFSAQYGNRLSSVLDISMREGSRERFSADLEMGIAGFGAIVEGPISEKGSYMFSLRRSYLEFLEGAIGLTAVPEYWNLNAKMVYQLNPSNKLTLISLGGIDDIQFVVDPDDLEDPSLENTDFGGWQTINGINWQHLISPTVFGNLALSDAMYAYNNEVFDEELGNQLTFRQRDIEGVTSLRYGLTILPRRIGEFRVGFDARVLRANYDLQLPLGVLSPLNPEPVRLNPISLDERFSTTQAGAYAEFSPKISTRLTLNIGGRYEYFDFIEASRISPRASLRFALHPAVNLNASWGHYYQMPSLVFLNADPVNKDLKPMRADHYIAGLSFFPRDDIRITAEGYIKEYADYPVSTQFETLTLANTGDDFGVNNLLFPMTSEGNGISRGLEIYAQKKMTNNFYGQISYSYSQTEHQALDGVRRPASFDIPHTFTILGGYAFGEWELSGKFTYASGRPFTPYLTDLSTDQNRAILDLSQVNAGRAPEYHRLDIRVDRRFNFTNWSLLAFLDLLNVYNRENIQQFIWNPKTVERDVVPQYAFIPNLGFNVKF